MGDSDAAELLYLHVARFPPRLGPAIAAPLCTVVEHETTCPDVAAALFSLSSAYCPGEGRLYTAL